MLKFFRNKKRQTELLIEEIASYKKAIDSLTKKVDRLKSNNNTIENDVQYINTKLTTIEHIITQSNKPTEEKSINAREIAKQFGGHESSFENLIGEADLSEITTTSGYVESDPRSYIRVKPNNTGLRIDTPNMLLIDTSQYPIDFIKLKDGRRLNRVGHFINEATPWTSAPEDVENKEDNIG